MLFKKIQKRKYKGLLVIAISILLLVSTLSLSSLKNLPFLDTHKDIVTLGSYAALIAGAYLVAGPVGAVVALIPAVATGCFGGGGGGGRPKPEPDLGEPPEPPQE